MHVRQIKPSHFKKINEIQKMNLYSNGWAQIKKRGRHNHSTRLKISSQVQNFLLRCFVEPKIRAKRTEETIVGSELLLTG